jgi:hypothetical protein
VSPLVASWLFGVIYSAIGSASGKSLSLLEPVLGAGFFAVFSLPISYGLFLVIGVPAFFVFRRSGWLSRRNILLGASAIGFFSGLVFAYIFGSQSAFELIAAGGLFTLLGASAGYSFWWFAYGGPP